MGGDDDDLWDDEEEPVGHGIGNVVAWVVGLVFLGWLWICVGEPMLEAARNP